MHACVLGEDSCYALYYYFYTCFLTYCIEAARVYCLAVMASRHASGSAASGTLALKSPGRPLIATTLSSHTVRFTCGVSAHICAIRARPLSTSSVDRSSRLASVVGPNGRARPPPARAARAASQTLNVAAEARALEDDLMLAAIWVGTLPDVQQRKRAIGPLEHRVVARLGVFGRATSAASIFMLKQRSPPGQLANFGRSGCSSFDRHRRAFGAPCSSVPSTTSTSSPDDG